MSSFTVQGFDHHPPAYGNPYPQSFQDPRVIALFDSQKEQIRQLTEKVQRQEGQIQQLTGQLAGVVHRLGTLSQSPSKGSDSRTQGNNELIEFSERLQKNAVQVGLLEERFLHFQRHVQDSGSSIGDGMSLLSRKLESLEHALTSLEVRTRAKDVDGEAKMREIEKRLVFLEMGHKRDARLLEGSDQAWTNLLTSLATQPAKGASK